MRRYKTHFVVRPVTPTERDYTLERQIRCNLTADSEEEARREVVHRALQQGVLVSHFLSVRAGRDV